MEIKPWFSAPKYLVRKQQNLNKDVNIYWYNTSKFQKWEVRMENMVNLILSILSVTKTWIIIMKTDLVIGLTSVSMVNNAGKSFQYKKYRCLTKDFFLVLLWVKVRFLKNWLTYFDLKNYFSRLYCYALHFCMSKLFWMGINCFGQVLIVLVRSKPSWSGSNNTFLIYFL